MMGSWRRYTVSGIAVTAAVAFALSIAATSARADHARSWNGMVMGGIIGGAIGSTIGKGSGRLAAIGAGTLLGSIYGGHIDKHRGHTRVHHPPAYRQYGWQGYRGHRYGWRAPRRHHQHGHHHGWRRPHVYAPVVAPPVVVVSPAPEPRVIRIQPVERSLQPEANYVISSSARATSGGYGTAAPSECRVLEDGWAPVYACRDAGGNWRILR